ncbi:MAG: hypothetical protein KGH92_04655, partial [Xanthomonadaceae bacterium]|nr:hypothetical protein [Xanthomonadaceae bacterium]
MAKRRRKGSMPRWPIAAIVVVAAGAALWFGRAHLPALRLPAINSPPGGVVIADAAHVDAENDGRRVRVSGLLTASDPARDAQLGVSA